MTRHTILFLCFYIRPIFRASENSHQDSSKHESTNSSVSGGKRVKELRPARMRSKSAAIAISENEHPSNDIGSNLLNPVILERSKTIGVVSGENAGFIDVYGAPLLSISPHGQELVVPLQHGMHSTPTGSNVGCGRFSSPGAKEMKTVRKKLFTSSSQDLSSSQSSTSLEFSCSAPAAMLRANIPPRHNGGQTSAPDSLSIITSSGGTTGLMLDVVTSSSIRIKSEGGRDRRNGKKSDSDHDKKTLSGVMRPPLSKEKLMKKARDGDFSLLELSGDDTSPCVAGSGIPSMIETGSPTIDSHPQRRNSKNRHTRTVEPIGKRLQVLDVKAKGGSNGTS